MMGPKTPKTNWFSRTAPDDDLKDGAQEEKEAAEAEMVKKYH